jgi:hypothetical protein
MCKCEDESREGSIPIRQSTLSNGKMAVALEQRVSTSLKTLEFRLNVQVPGHPAQ